MKKKEKKTVPKNGHPSLEARVCPRCAVRDQNDRRGVPRRARFARAASKRRTARAALIASQPSLRSSPPRHTRVARPPDRASRRMFSRGCRGTRTRRPATTRGGTSSRELAPFRGSRHPQRSFSFLRWRRSGRSCSSSYTCTSGGLKILFPRENVR